MSDARQLGLLEAIAARLGVQPAKQTGVTVGALYVRYRATKPRGRAWRLERNLLRPFVVRFWRRPVAELRLTDWETHRGMRRRQKTRTGRPPTEGTLNLELVRTRQMFSYGLRAELIQINPLALAKHVGRRRRRETVLTETQLRTLIVGAQQLRWRHQQAVFRAFTLAKGYSGLRMGEAMSIRRDRITLQGTYMLRASETKTKRSRVIGFTDETLIAFANVPQFAGNPRVFVNHNTGRPYAQGTMRKWLAIVAKATGLDAVVADGDFRLQARDLRASAASIADARGARATQVQDMLGHTSLRTTEIYLRRNKDDNALEMVKIMEGRRGPRRSALPSTHENEKEVVKRDRVTAQSVS